MLQMIAYFFVSLIASIVGAICGIGGGVIIKPVLDALSFGTVEEITFLSGCTVLAMSTYSMLRAAARHETAISIQITLPLAIGAAAGGILGKSLLSGVAAYVGNGAVVGAAQAIGLAVLSVTTLVVLFIKDKIRTFHIANPVGCVATGMVLGVVSSFLGIGGGPFNLLVLFILFSMETKTAAQNSLFIILFSQLASLLTTLITRSIPMFSPTALLLMVAGGIAGGMVGGAFNKRMNGRAVNRLLLVLLVVIVGISIRNYFSYVGI